MNNPYAQPPGEGQPYPGVQQPNQPPQDAQPGAVSSAAYPPGQAPPPQHPQANAPYPGAAPAGPPPAAGAYPGAQHPGGAPNPAAPNPAAAGPYGQQPGTGANTAPSAVPPAGAPGQAPQQQQPAGSNVEEQLTEALAGEPSDGTKTVDTRNEKLKDGVNRCPRCGATDIQLRASSGMLICLFCRHEWSEKQFDQNRLGEGPISNLRGTVIGSGAADIQADVNEIVTMKCSGCGAEVVVNTAQAMSARCHWCRHNLTVNEQIPNGAVPDAVLPFKLSRDDAVERIKEFASSRKMFAHKKFKQDFSPHNVLGVYLPYMVVDANASVTTWGEGEVQTRRYTRKRGDKTETLYDADLYQIERHVDFTADDLTIESSAERGNMNAFVNTNNIINAILPFDTENAVAWNANYLGGFSSEKRDVDVSGLEPLLDHQLLSIGRSRVQESVRNYGRGVRWEAERLNLHGSRWVSMYLPVWLYSYYHEERGKGMVHYIAVNARTGETMGSIPVSHGRILVAALTVGTILEGAAIGILAVTA